MLTAPDVFKKSTSKKWMSSSLLNLKNLIVINAFSLIWSEIVIRGFPVTNAENINVKELKKYLLFLFLYIYIFAPILEIFYLRNNSCDKLFFFLLNNNVSWRYKDANRYVIKNYQSEESRVKFPISSSGQCIRRYGWSSTLDIKP